MDGPSYTREMKRAFFAVCVAFALLLGVAFGIGLLL